jgi:hypothetical protein
VTVSLDRSPMTELPSFEPGPLSSYVHFYLAIRSQLERVWQSIVAIEVSLREELGPFAEDLAPVEHESLKTLVDAPRALPAELASLWLPEDAAGLSGINDVYQVAGRFSFQGEADVNLARVTGLVARAKAATMENDAALRDLSTLRERALAKADALVAAEKARAERARETGTSRFDPLAETVLSRAKQTIEALAAVQTPTFEDGRAAGEDYKRLRAKLQQVYQTCLPFLQGAIAQLFGLTEGSVPQTYPTELPLVPELPTELLQITPVGSEEVEQAERTLAALSEEERTVERARATLGEELSRSRGKLEALGAKLDENGADLALAVMLHDWMKASELAGQQRARIADLERELSARVAATGAQREYVTGVRATLTTEEGVAIEKRATLTAASEALAELSKKEPLLFGKEEWRTKVSEAQVHVASLTAELEGLEKGLGQRRAELSAHEVRAQTAEAEQSIVERSLSDARTRRSEIEAVLVALAEKLGTRRPTRPVPQAETEELVLALERQRAGLAAEVESERALEKRHEADAARAAARLKQIEVEKRSTEARVEGARIARAEGLEAAERRLAEQRKQAVDDHVREILGALSKSIAQVGTVFIEPARQRLQAATEPDFAEAERVRSAVLAVSPVLARILAERGPELSSVSELCDKIHKEFCEPAKDACTRAWG